MAPKPCRDLECHDATTLVIHTARGRMQVRRIRLEMTVMS